MKVELKIWRYDSTTGDRALTRVRGRRLPTRRRCSTTSTSSRTSVDGSLAYRKSCRMMICGSCGMRVDGGAVLACKTRDVRHRRGRPRARSSRRWATCRSSRTSSSTWIRSGRRCAPSSRTCSRGYDQAPRARERRLAAADGRDPQGVALHQLRLLRLRVQLDGVRSGLPRPGRAREGLPLRRRPPRRRHHRAARAVLGAARDLGLHPLLLLQRALPEGRRPARRDREARRRGDEERHRPRHGREAREVVRHLGEDDRLAPRDRARARRRRASSSRSRR